MAAAKARAPPEPPSPVIIVKTGDLQAIKAEIA